MVEHFALYPYRLELSEPYVWAKGTQNVRRGLIVCAADDGCYGYGEVAPPPHQLFDSNEFQREALRALKGSGSLQEDLCMHLDKAGISPRLRCGLVSAWFSLSAAKRGISLGELLGERTGRIPSPIVPINALITDEAPAMAGSSAAQHVAAGYSTIKIKMFGRNHELDRARVGAVRAAAPRATLRLDPNCSWSLHDALVRIGELSEFEPEYIEDPLPADTSLEQMAELVRKSPIRIAADESAADLASIRAIVDAKAADVIIMKTQRLGGPDKVLEAADLLDERGISHTLTGSLESAVGAMVGLHCASLLRQPIAPCGLGTARYFAGDLGKFPAVERGGIRVPSTAGLGIAIEGDW